MQVKAKLYRDKTTFVYQPGGTPGDGNVYSDFAKLYQALSASSGPRTVYFDTSIVSPAVIPAGVYDFKEVTFDAAQLGGFTPVEVSDGVSWTDLITINNINLNFLNTAPVEVLNTAHAIFLNGANANANGTAPIWQIAAGAQFQLKQGSGLSGSVTAAAVEVLAGQTLQLVLGLVSAVNATAIIGDGTTTLINIVADETGGFTTQTGFTGTVNQVVLTDAKYLGYSPLVSADYPAPAPAQVAAALDSISNTINVTNSKQIYVDADGGDDVTGTGSILRPFKTIEAAFTFITAAADGNYILILAAGDYGVAPIVWPVLLNKNISLQGVDGARISQPITYTALGLSDENVTFHQVSINAGITFDLTLATIAIFIASDCSFSSVTRTDALPPGPQLIKFVNCGLDALDISGTCLILNCQFFGGGTKTIQTAGLVVMTSSLFSSMAISIDGTLAMTATLAQGTTFTGPGTLNSDSSSLLNTINSVGTTSFQDNTNSVGYTPAISGNWAAPIPTQAADALDKTSAQISQVNPKQVWVDVVKGSDVTGTGSQLRPFASLPTTLAYIATQGAGAYMIEMGPGFYTGAPITWPDGSGGESVNINGPLNTCTIGHAITMAPAAIPNFAFVCTNIGFSTPLVLDLALPSSAQVRIINSGLQLQRIDSNPATVVGLFFCGINSLDLTGVTNVAQSCYGVGSITIQAASALRLVDSLIVFGSVNVIGSLDVIGTSSNIPLAGVGAVRYDATSKKLITDSGGSITAATQVLLDDAESINFVPAVSGNWSVAPVQVKQALDELADRVNNNVVPNNRAINTTAPLAGGGDLSADRTLSIPVSTDADDGYLSATDHASFAAKVAATRAINTTAPLTGGGDLSADRTIAIPAADTMTDGYLTSADWNIFNAKQKMKSFVHQVTAGEITAKQLTLPSTPITNTEVMASLEGAGGLTNGIDFSVSGTTFDWTALGLDGLIAAGEWITIWYATT